MATTKTPRLTPKADPPTAPAAVLQTSMHFATPDTNVKKLGLYYVPFSKLRLATSFDNPEQKFNRRVDLGPKEELVELMESLYRQGPRMPLKAKKVAGQELYDVYQGERRYTAAQMAFKKYGVDIIFPVIVYGPEANRKTIKLDTILTNDGKPLNPLERADIVEDLVSVEGLSEKDAAEMLGVSRVYIMNLRRLGKIPEKAKKLIVEGIVSPTELMQFLKQKDLDLDSLIEEIQRAAKEKGGRVTAKDLRKKKDGDGDGDGEEDREEVETRSATSLGEFKRYRRQNPGLYENKHKQAAYEFLCQLIDNQLSYDNIREFFTGK